MVNKMIKDINLNLSTSSLDNRAIVFDLDGTLLFGDIGETVFYTLLILDGLGVTKYHEFDIFENIFNQSKISIPGNAYLSNIIKKYLWNLKNHKMRDAYCLTTEYMEKYDPQLIYRLVHKILKRGLPKTTIKVLVGEDKFILQFHAVTDPILSSLIKSCQVKKARVLIISASPQSIVEGFCKFMKLPLHVAKGARCIGENVPIVPYGEEKMRVLSEEGITNPYIVFGNSEGDFDMLDAGYFSFVRKVKNKIIQNKVANGEWYYID